MFCHRHCICLRLCCCLFVGQVIFSHQSDQMSQRSQVSKIALWRCTLNVTSEITLYCCEMSYCQWCRPEQGTDIATYWAGSDCVWIKDWSGLAFASVTSWEKFWFGAVANSICGGNSRFALNFVTFWYQRISSTPNTSQSPWTIGSISFMSNGHCPPPVLVGKNIREGTSFKISNQFMMPFTNTLMKYEINKKKWNKLRCPLQMLWWNIWNW